MIPKNFDVLPENKEKSEKPTLVFQDGNNDLWYHKDDKFERPKAVVQAAIYVDQNNAANSLMWREILD
jgi:secreted Zn-dependent insulinase-like peptidase